MNIMQKFLLPLSILIFIACNETGGPSEIEKELPELNTVFLTADELKIKLESAYESSSEDSLKAFFQSWNRSILPQPLDSIRKNDTLEAIYQVFYEFYSPYKLSRLGNWERDDSFNLNAEYLVIQNVLWYTVLEDSTMKQFADNDYDIMRYRMYTGEMKFDTVFNFRPPVKYVNPKEVLYLTGNYWKAIQSFLGNDFTPMGEDNVMSPAMPEGESQNRYRTLKKYITLIPDHWGYYHHVITHPEVYTIVFDNVFSTAIVSFRIGYQGGRAILKKKNGHWKLTQSEATWIE